MPTSAVRVLLDATAVPPDRGGVGRYVDSLVPALVRTDLDVAVVCRPEDVEHYGGLGGEPIAARMAPGRPGRMLWEQTGLPALARRHRPDVLHSPHYTQPLVARVATAVTLHDATFFTDPLLHGRLKRLFFRSATRLALRRADIGIVPSRATAEELVRVAGADPGALCVAYHGVDPQVFQPPSSAQSAAARTVLGLEPDAQYIAFLGTLEPRKNLTELVAGYVQACAARVDPPALVLAGGSGWDQALDAAIAAAPLNVRILRPGYLPLENLAGYLGGAVAVAYPSLGEGFGLPVLEAMACGAAVMTTRRLALPEVGGDAVEYCGVDAASIGSALTLLLDDPGRRSELSRSAQQRAQLFTWDASAQAHRGAYDRAMSAFRSAA
ncbi:MAG: glycosyltransferase family 1 protein [Pseudonocardiales bacterium]|nr:glycosyltransferase family 1 protein [Pseudonocardiales bacterium]